MVLLNAAPAQRLEPGLLSQLDALVVNEREATALTNDEQSPNDAAAALRARGPRIAVITLGPSGSLFCDDTGVHRVEPFPVKAIDTTGAGDAFMGALAVALAAALPSAAAVRFANAAGAAATSSLGAQAALPRLDDLRRLFGLHVPSLEA
jgi:ribokinase